MYYKELVLYVIALLIIAPQLGMGMIEPERDNSLLDGEQGLMPTGELKERKSEIPKMILTGAQTTLSMCINNSGNTTAQYRITLTFSDQESENEFRFNSSWTEAIAPGKETYANVVVTLPARSIPEGRESCRYEIISSLEVLSKGGTGINMSLLETKQKYTEEIMARDGVLGIGVGKDAIIVYTEIGVSVTPAIPATLDDWPVIVIPTERSIAW